MPKIVKQGICPATRQRCAALRWFHGEPVCGLNHDILDQPCQRIKEKKRKEDRELFEKILNGG